MVEATPAGRRGLAVLLLAACVLGGAAAQPDTETPKLKFNEDGKLKIVFFTDTHTAESAEKDKKTKELMTNVLKAEQAEGGVDMVMFGGDQVTGLDWLLIQEPGFYEYHWKKLIQPVLDAKVPFLNTLGNHDGEADLTRHEIQKLVQATSPLSLAQAGPNNITGAANYHVDIYDSEGQEVVGRLWVLDSMDRSCMDVGEGWGCVANDTNAWLIEEAAKLPEVPVQLALIHIPVQEFIDLWNEGETNGTRGEPPGCGLVNTGTFQALKDAGVQAIYSGHDHANDYIGMWDGVRLAYGRQSGYGRYGPPPGMVRGARVIELQLNQSAAESGTWIRLENGEREDQTATPADNKAEKVDGCAAMEVKDKLGKRDCEDGVHWIDSTDLNCASSGIYNAVPNDLGAIQGLILKALPREDFARNVTLLFPTPDIWSDTLYWFNQSQRAGLQQFPPEVADTFLPYLMPGTYPTALELSEAGNIESFAGTNVTVTMDPETRDFYAIIRQTDGRELFFRVLDYPVQVGPLTGMFVYAPQTSLLSPEIASQPKLLSEIPWKTLIAGAANSSTNGTTS